MRDTDYSPAAAPGISKSQLRLTLGALMLASALAAIEGNIVTTALPVIASELNGLSGLSWIITGFMLCQASSMPLYGKISDMYGRKPLFLVAIAFFIIASLLCGIAQDMTQLIVFRSLQGIGAAGIMTMSSASLADVLTPRERGRYQGLFMSVFAIASMAGPPLGGLLIATAGWRWVFLINVPIGLLILAVIWAVLPRSTKRVEHNIDYLGSVLMIAATSCLLLALSWGGLTYPWFSWQIISLSLATVVLVFLLLKQEKVAPEPILPLHIFKDRTVAICSITTAMVAFPFFGAVVFLPLYLQVVLGMSPAAAGTMIIAQIGGLLVASTIGGFVVSHTGRYKLFICLGVFFLCAGMAMLGFAVGARTGAIPLLVGLAVLGIGGGLCMPNFTVAAQNAVHQKDLGAVTAIITFANVLAGAAGVAMAGAILNGRLDAFIRQALPGVDAKALLDGGLMKFAQLPAKEHEVVMAAHAHAVSATYLTGAALIVLALIAALMLPSVKLRDRSDLPTDVPAH